MNRWEIYDPQTRELLDAGAHVTDVAEAMERLAKQGVHNVVLVQREPGDEDTAVPWGEIAPKRVLTIHEGNTDAVNRLFLGLTFLADDMGKANDPFTERLDNLIETFFAAVTDEE